MSFTPKERKRVEKLRRKHRIEFGGEVPPDEWPNSHRSTFSAVQRLGKTEFDTYAARAKTIEDAPWAADIKNNAEELSQRAKLCVRRNESTWRFACEPYALARLTSEVACKLCRKRVWRSEIEATTEGNSAKVEALRARQRKREPCRCSRDFRPRDLMEPVGLNRIFGHREDELIHHDSDIEQELQKATKPDAVYGLRQTRNIENLMNDRARVSRPANDSDMLVNEFLGEPPLDEEGDSLIFPFLLLEAKSGKSANSDWHSVQLQSAFPVRTLLCAQESLRDMSKPHANQQLQDPLLWLLMNRGEDWRICAASVNNNVPKKPGTVGATEYRIFDLWGGPITSKNGALQLLLIVDYIFEWARDIYREDILTKLRIVASGENDRASVIYPDTDIMSTMTSSHPGMVDKDHEDTHDSYNQGIKAFEALDSRHGIVRHATFVQSQYRCFFVTRDNVKTMLQSTQDQVRKVLARQIITRLQEVPLFMSWDCLNMMEKEWTGRSRISRWHHLDQVKFYASVTYASFILPNWTQVRELSVIAVAKDAYDDLVVASMYSPRRASSRPPVVKTECEIESLKSCVAKLHAGDTRHTLLTAIKRICLRVAGSGSQIAVVPCNGIPRDIVHYIYNDFKRGLIEPQESFVHTSTSFDQIHLSKSSLQPFDVGNLNISPDGCVLVYAESHPYDSPRQMSRVCVFFTDGPPNAPTPETLGSAIRNTFESYDVYHTSRWNRVANFRALGKDKDGKRWNLANSYGIFIQGFHFLNWISSLGCEPPVRQGSTRPGTSDDLFSRKFYAWREPDYIYTDISRRVFLIYKIVTKEVRYWRAIAKERKDQGIDCCDVCAREPEMADGLCYQCSEKFLKVNELWFQNALLGEQPIAYEPLEPDSPKYGRHKHFDFKGYEIKDINAKFEKHLNFYEGLDEEYNDLQDLQAQAVKFIAAHKEAEWPSRKRKRSIEALSELELDTTNDSES
ncbi:hypothetical protein N7493_001206 [Penicillium malachiteum]|uniref:Uncharacterized protein n=1 Tax=Penicillium malachiteum TaxID=1324776 RepID=A0AAD6HTT4_9EURO|nr:hypothetical protein N7493_001206 [Penicillium malachiteum]